MRALPVTCTRQQKKSDCEQGKHRPASTLQRALHRRLVSKVAPVADRWGTALAAQPALCGCKRRRWLCGRRGTAPAVFQPAQGRPGTPALLLPAWRCHHRPVPLPAAQLRLLPLTSAALGYRQAAPLALQKSGRHQQHRPLLPCCCQQPWKLQALPAGCQLPAAPTVNHLCLAGCMLCPCCHAVAQRLMLPSRAAENPQAPPACGW